MTRSPAHPSDAQRRSFLQSTGLALATATVRVLGERVSLFDPLVLPWVAGVSLLGLLTATTLVVGQAWAQARVTTVRRALMIVGRSENPIWQRVGFSLFIVSPRVGRTAYKASSRIVTAAGKNALR